MDANIREKFAEWSARAGSDADLARELEDMASDEERIEDAFCRSLEFGTGGLRGVIGAGTNRINVHTVAWASQGLADYVKARYPEDRRRIAIGYDSRIKSDVFARTAAGVFAANGIQVRIWPEIMPVPCLSFAVRELGCCAGVMVTASHNPAEYNGYKVYGEDGCQITDKAAASIFSAMEKLDVFDDVRSMDFGEALDLGIAGYIGEDTYTAYVESVKALSLEDDEAGMPGRSVPIVYTPLNGAGLKPVLRVLRESGFANIRVVPEQERPDGRFPTCPYPNPEVREAMELGLEYARRCRAGLLLATDPDCDRVGVAVMDGGGYALLTGNETGILLLDYVCARLAARGAMPSDPVMIKTIVTTDIAERIAAKYGVRTVNVLTGFKYIGEQIGLMEGRGRADSFIFGFEESCGYLSGRHVRDKDGVNAALLICEMYAWYAARGISLTRRLEELYREHGCRVNVLHSYGFEGMAGFSRMREIMAAFRAMAGAPGAGIGGRRILAVKDYALGLDGLPKSDVLKIFLEGGCSVVVRPSGTEPRLKAYVSAGAETLQEAAGLEHEIAESLGKIIQ